MAYFLGSIPTGYLVGRFRGVDLRQIGSGNIGATNAFRILGKKAGIFVLIVDALKGYLACGPLAALTWSLFHRSGGGTDSPPEMLSLLAGVAAILGHNYTCWLRFKGGKGIATTAGVLLALALPAFLTAVGLWGLVFFISRYVSLASIACAICLPLIVWLWGGGLPLIIFSLLVSALALYKHRSNMQRLLQGTEHRFGSPKEHKA